MVTRKPRVLMLVTELSMGGAAKVVREVSAMLAGRFEVHEAVFNVGDGVDFPGTAPVHSLGVAGGGGFLIKSMNFARRISRTRRLKRQLGIDVSISHLEGAHYVDALSRRGEKMVLCIHGSMVRDHEPKGLREWLRLRAIAPLIYRRADRIVTVSRDIAPQMVLLGIPAAKTVTINNSFDVEGIEARSREPLSDEERQIYAGAPVLVTSGRFAKQKNQARLLDIFAELIRSRPAKLVMLGDGPLREELVARADALGLKTYRAWSGEPLTGDRDLYFLGNRANPFPFLRHASLFVLPSAWEGFPLSVGEAMACGLPVVASDCPTGPREMLAPDSAVPERPIRQAEGGAYGVLMPMLVAAETLAADREIWVETLARLLDDLAERNRLAAAGRARVEDFSPEKIAPQWLRLIDELLERPATTSS